MRLALLGLLAVSACAHTQRGDGSGAITVFRGAVVLDGTGAEPVVDDLVVRRGRIIARGDVAEDMLEGATIVDVSGKFIMPMMVDMHTHVGLLAGTTTASAHYTRENVERQLVRFRDYGVQAVLALGSDRVEGFAWRDESRDDLLAGARLYTAGLGFGVPQGMPPLEMGFDQVFRPATAEEARENVRDLVRHRPDVLKVWVDDFWGKYPKMQPEIYTAIIDEAHKHGVRVAAHVYHLEDARALVAAGIDIIAHSIRDAKVDAELVATMAARGVVYVPTLSIDKFAFAYASPPAWLNDAFFSDACEPGVLDMLKSPAYAEKVRANPITAAERDAYATALYNLKALYGGGVTIAMGTDAGANAVRVQGFSEHHELANMVMAGLSPLEAITAATGNSAKALGIDDDTGTLRVGKDASFIILRANPLTRIENTQQIDAVYYRGRVGGTSKGR